LSPPDETGLEALSPQVNTYVVKSAFANEVDLDTGIENATGKFFDSVVANTNASKKMQHNIHYLFDSRIDSATALAYIELDHGFLVEHQINAYSVTASTGSPNKLDLVKRRKGDSCPNCQQNTLDIQKAIEVGHTFHLGTRYSSKLGTKVVLAGEKESTPVEMGCHGIGVSRLVAAIAACLSDEKGLNWPRVIAPFQVVIIVKREHSAELDDVVMDLSGNIASSDPNSATDVLYDDRTNVNLAWKMNDADFIGYPVLVVFGKAWEKGEGKVEVQCRQLKVKANVCIDDVPSFVQDLLRQL